jgi:hypothetical protein
LTSQKNPRGPAPRLGTFALSLNALNYDVEPADFTPPPELGVGTGSTAIRSPQTLPERLAHDLPHPRGLAVDATSAYVLTHPTHPTGSAQLLQIDRDAGVVRVLTTLVQPDELAVDDLAIYWTESQAGAVKRMSKRGGDVITLARAVPQPTCLALGPAGIFWATRNHDVVRAADGDGPTSVVAHFDSQVTGLRVDGNDLLIALDAGELWRVSLNGLSRQLYQTRQCFSRGFVQDSKRVYWIDDLAGAILCVGKRGGKARRLADAPGGEGHLAVNADGLVWSDAEASTLMRLGRDGEVGIAAAGLAGPAEVAIVGEWIVWINRADGSVMTLRQG